MGDPPPGLSLHRINNDGNYEPSNCCWAPMSVQNANRRHRPINVADLKERIATGGPIRRKERDFVLDCINAYAPPDDAAAPPPF
jgi:predicted nucleotidyltransferase